MVDSLNVSNFIDQEFLDIVHEVKSIDDKIKAMKNERVKIINKLDPDPEKAFLKFVDHFGPVYPFEICLFFDGVLEENKVRGLLYKYISANKLKYDNTWRAMTA